MQPSPYTPGTVARNVVGRERQLEDVQRQLAFMSQFPQFGGRIEVYVGPRGVGKTSLLRAMQKDADDLDFATVWVTAGDGPFLLALIETFRGLSRSWKDKTKETLAGLFDALTVTVGGVSVAGGRSGGAESSEVGSLGRRLQEIIALAGNSAVKEKNRGLVLFIDEIQAADEEGLRALAYAWQHLQSESPDLPVIALTAGLSHSQDVITDAVSFAERFRYNHLMNLVEDAAREALVNPALLSGVTWADEALEGALEEARGYPYFLQLIGDEVWNSANYPDAGVMLTEQDLHAARASFLEAQLSFFRSRWLKATPREAEFMTAMAALGEGPSRRKDIAEQMGTSTTSISMVRRSLMDKGLIESSGHGYLDFTAPGFADYVRRESDVEQQPGLWPKRDG